LLRSLLLLELLFLLQHLLQKLLLLELNEFLMPLSLRRGGFGLDSICGCLHVQSTHKKHTHTMLVKRVSPFKIQAFDTDALGCHPEVQAPLLEVALSVGFHSEVLVFLFTKRFTAHKYT
jgi:hypothetical protein